MIRLFDFQTKRVDESSLVFLQKKGEKKKIFITSMWINKYGDIILGFEEDDYVNEENFAWSIAPKQNMEDKYDLIY